MYRVAAICFLLSLWNTSLHAQKPHKCQLVRLADIGWTDVSATTALASVLLEKQGYTPKISLLSMPVTFKGLSDGSLDVFLGNWMPSQEADIRPYLQQQTVVQLTSNLTQAKFALAVPSYVYEAGVHSIGDLYQYADRFHHRIYGIEPGNDGNRQILRLLEDPALKMDQFEIIESSEQGMLMAVKNAIRDHAWVVFLAWEPHPMNTLLSLNYLEGGDAYFGPHFGESTVYTITRKGFAQECPQLNQFFSHLKFELQDENTLMKLILEDHLPPVKAAQQWLQEHPVFATQALAFLPALTKNPLNQLDDLGNSFKANKIPIGHWAQEGVENINSHFAKEFNSFSDTIEGAIRAFIGTLDLIPPFLFYGILTLVVFIIRRSLVLTLGTFLALLLVYNLGLWEATLETLVLISLATFLSVALGVPLGIFFGHRPHLFKWFSPLLDLMQTIPTFVYLIPTLMLFGLGLVPGLISTIVFAMPAAIRLTYLGIKQIPPELIEAGRAFGASKHQLLWLIELPAAKTTIIEGASQCIMLSLSMVVVAALVGADGLGVPIVRALNTVDIGLGFDAGITIVLMAILLDRIVRHKNKPEPARS